MFGSEVRFEDCGLRFVFVDLNFPLPSTCLFVVLVSSVPFENRLEFSNFLLRVDSNSTKEDLDIVVFPVFHLFLD